MYPLSKRIPSVSSSSRPKVLDSSTVMTPSLPTLSMASAIISPMVTSPAEMDAVEAICSLVSTSLESLDSSSLTASTAASMPRLSDIGLAPAATFRRPSRTSAWASTVAVAGNVVGLLRYFLDQLGTDLLPRVLELDLLGDGHAIVGDRGGAPLLLENHIPALGAEGYLHGVGKLVHAALEAAPGVLVKRDHLRCHWYQSSVATLGPADARDGRHARRQSLPATGQYLIARSCRFAVTLIGRVLTPCLALSGGECKRRGPFRARLAAQRASAAARVPAPPRRSRPSACAAPESAWRAPCAARPRS